MNMVKLNCIGCCHEHPRFCVNCTNNFVIIHHQQPSASLLPSLYTQNLAQTLGVTQTWQQQYIGTQKYHTLLLQQVSSCSAFMTTAKVIVWTPVKVITTLALFVFAGLAGKVLLTTPLCIFL